MKIKVNNIKINYEKYGNGCKNIIFLHGNGENLSIFKEIVNCFGEDYTVYLVDTRAHGDSEDVKELHYTDMAEDIARFIQVLQINKPILFGFSDGGNTGLLLSGMYPELLSKLIIAGANLYPNGMKSVYVFFMKLSLFFSKNKMVKLMATEPNITKEFLSKIKIPVVVLAGSKDIIKESHTREIAKYIKNSELRILKGETHSSYIVNNKKLYNIIKKYI
ncbi:alpha/beta hydrolase [Peptostreptococcaceae bacterium OttesenSCG-928-C18]|nr:alpha/beta hydrolase [Peptostreptococcaceae bacterium OttesenSCG-928-C18]